MTADTWPMGEPRRGEPRRGVVDEDQLELFALGAAPRPIVDVALPIGESDYCISGWPVSEQAGCRNAPRPGELFCEAHDPGGEWFARWSSYA